MAVDPSINLIMPMLFKRVRYASDGDDGRHVQFRHPNLTTVLLFTVVAMRIRHSINGSTGLCPLSIHLF